MNIMVTHSPFYNIRKTLKFLRRILGFPLQAKDDSFVEFRFVLWLECIRFLPLLLLPLGSQIFLSFWYLTTKRDLLLTIYNLVKLYRDMYSANSIDLFLAMSWSLSGVILSFSCILIFKYNTQNINNFLRDAAMIRRAIHDSFNVTPNIGKTKFFKNLAPSEKFIITGQIFSFLISFLYGIVHYNSFIQSPNDIVVEQFGIESSWPLTIMIAIQVLFTFYGPVACASELLICQMIHTLTEIFHDWEIFLKTQPNLDFVVNHEQKEIKETSCHSLEEGDMYVNHNIK